MTNRTAGHTHRRPPELGEKVNGFYNGGGVYLRESRGNQILIDFVHEGTHALDHSMGGIFFEKTSKWYAKDWRNLTPQQVYKREIRAYRAEKLLDGIPHFDSREKLIDHIFYKYNAAEPGDLP
jgi:hypothetical protein